MRVKISKYCCFILIAILLVACGNYIDKVKRLKTHKIMEGTFSFYPDSNILVYRSNVELSTGGVASKPKPFRIKLPKGLKNYKVSNSQDFTFNYEKNQAIHIHMELIHCVPEDTTFIPNSNEISRFIQKFVVHDDSKYTLSNIPIVANRKQRIFKKGCTSILLYNIKNRNESEFTKLIESLELLDSK